MDHKALRVVTCQNRGSVEAHIGAWKLLSARASSGEVLGEWFAGPSWLLPLLEVYFPTRNWQLHFVYDGAELAGVVPFVVGALGDAPCNAGATFPVNSHVRRIGMLSLLPYESLLSAALPHIMQHAADTGGRQWRRRCLAFRQIGDDDPLCAAVLIARSKLGWEVNTYEETRSAVVDIPGGWDAYVASRTREQLHPLRRRKKMDKAGGWVFHRADRELGVDESWRRLLEIERASWKHGEGTSIANEPGANAFYSSVARACADEGQLRVHLLEHDGKPVAHTFGVVTGATYYLLKHSYDNAHRSISPGFQLMWHVMQESVAEGCTRIDFLGDAMSWKVALATSLPSYKSLMLFPASNLRCQACRITQQVIKPAARRMGLGLLRAALRRSTEQNPGHA
jgi:hypothetical protein